MIGNILKVIAACLIGYLAGLLLGGALGILIGLVPSLFSREIFALNLSIAVSILLFVILGVFGYGVLDASEAEVFSQFFSPVVLIYCGAAGSRIGSAIFSVFATVQTIREIVKSNRVQALPGARNG